MSHPSEQDLALFSTGDLGRIAALKVQWHVKSCTQCAAEIAQWRTVPAALRARVDQMPAGVNWERLAAEMTANIHLGLEAGECIGTVRVRRDARMGWRMAAAMAGMTAVLLGAWWLNPPPVPHQPVMHSSRMPIEIRTAQDGLELNENGSALILMHTRGQQSPIIMSAPGSLRARYVDEDTGQVTINNVYSD